MERRKVGVLVLIAAAFAAVIVPGVVGRRVVGEPVAAAVAPAPAIGACVLALSALPPTDQDTADDVRVSYPTAEYGDCAGSIVGEVMSVDLTTHPLRQATVGSYQSAKSDCELAEVNYVGSIGPFDPATITTPGIAWQADVVVESISVGPSAVQRGAGQSWIACIGAAVLRTAYRGSLAKALTVGVLPPAFATCWRSLASAGGEQIAKQVAPCGSPHPIEVLALTDAIQDGTTLTKIDQSCLGMAARAMRTTDPTRGGQLRVAAYSTNGSSFQPITSVGLGAGYLACLASVAGPRQLTGTLIGIGSKPLPTTG